MINRRGLITGLVAFIAAPAIVPVSSLMPVKVGLWDEAAKLILPEHDLIETAFLLSLFKVLSEHPYMTATRILELANERTLLVA